jgi:putative ATP-binding cassette transporter
LRAALLYPAHDLACADAALGKVLVDCGLRHLVHRLDDVERWDQILSSGERQRLAFARLFLHRPAVVILDEATSALDEAGQTALMSLLRESLPDTTLISIGHRPGLETFHDRRLTLTRHEDGARLTCERALQLVRAMG